MGCNCKKTLSAAEKYADGQTEEKQGIIFKILVFCTQLIFGAIACAIILILLVPIIIYILICILFGKEPSIRLINPYKWFKKGKNT